MSPSMVALIPARAGSKRCPGKNSRQLGGKPLIQWTVETAEASGVFANIVVCSDAIDIIVSSGHGTFWLRETARDDQPDIVWVSQFLAQNAYDAFAILRPTSPFRTAETIRRAWAQFSYGAFDSLRAIEPVTEHPGKMWRLDGDVMHSLLDGSVDGVPWHSCPTQTLPPVYRQNASLELAWTKTVRDSGTIAGNIVAPFFTYGLEGFDVNTEDDFAQAEAIVAAMSRAGTLITAVVPA